MNTKKNLDADWADAVQTLESLREVIVKQRKKWHNMISEEKEESLGGWMPRPWLVKFFEYIVKLHKESEVLEHMINRIEDGMSKSRCTIT